MGLTVSVIACVWLPLPSSRLEMHFAGLQGAWLVTQRFFVVPG